MTPLVAITTDIPPDFKARHLGIAIHIQGKTGVMVGDQYGDVALSAVTGQFSEQSLLVIIETTGTIGGEVGRCRQGVIGRVAVDYITWSGLLHAAAEISQPEFGSLRLEVEGEHFFCREIGSQVSSEGDIVAAL